MNDDKIYIKITGDYYHKPLVKSIISLTSNTANNIVFNVSDCPGCFIWNGGHNVNIDVKCSPEDFIKHIKEFNNNNISYSVIFNNTALQEEHLKDESCNKILNYLNTCEYKDNSVTVGSELLYKYIKNNYPNIKIQCSATKQLYSQEDIEKEKASHEYSRIVLAADASKFIDILKKIKNKDEIELIIDEQCVPNCPYKKEHYEATSKWMISHDPSINITCRMRNSSIKEDITCSFDEIKNLYDIGFRHFKITHREFNEPSFRKNLLIYIEYFKRIDKLINNN